MAIKREKRMKIEEKEEGEDNEFKTVFQMTEANKCDFDYGDENADDPVTLTFKDQAQQRARVDKAAKASARAILQCAKEERKKKLASALPYKVIKKKNKKAELDEVMQFSEDEETESKKSIQNKVGKQELDEDETSEFKIADTFDFRQYLPMNVPESSEREDDNEVDSEEEELANTIIEGGYTGESDEGYNGSDEHEVGSRRRKPHKEAPNVQNHSVPLPHGVAISKTPNRRGGRRVRKKHSNVPRVIILGYQGLTSAEAIRARADAFIQQRLFPKDLISPGPHRMDRATLESISAKKRARIVSLTL